MRARRPRLLAALIGIAAVVVGLLWSAGFLDRGASTLFPAEGRRAGVTALYFSGDMGLRFGMGPVTAQALARRGIPVLGVATSTLFRLHRTRAETDAIVATAIRQGLAAAGRDRLVLIGQSFGADVLQTGLVDLPADLRRRIAAVVLVVPGTGVFFRADPTGLAYRGARDSDGAATIARLDWVPLTCIYGTAELDSACPAARSLSDATVIAMPGGHFLRRDEAGLVRHVLAAIAPFTRR